MIMMLLFGQKATPLPYTTATAHPVSSLRGICHNILGAHGVEQAGGPSKHCRLGQEGLVPSTQVTHHLLHAPTHSGST